MNRKLLFFICAVVVAVFALGYLLLPSFTLSLLGFSTDSTGLLTTRFIGVLSMGYVVILWKIRDSEIKDQQPVLLGLFITMGFASCVSLFHQLAGSFGNLGWIGVGMFAFAFIVFGYTYIKK